VGLVPAVLLLALLPSGARGQTSGGLSARATVVASLTVSGTADLAFGTVATTSSKVVLARNGGRFSINGAANQPVGVSLALPPDLGHSAVVVGSWTGLQGTSPGAGAASAFTPSGTSQTFTLSGAGRLFLWVGATLVTTAAPIGNYSSPIVLTVVYN
jgi:spore coat protein U-like protein